MLQITFSCFILPATVTPIIISLLFINHSVILHLSDVTIISYLLEFSYINNEKVELYYSNAFYIFYQKQIHASAIFLYRAQNIILYDVCSLIHCLLKHNLIFIYINHSLHYLTTNP